jgi:diguanylate cyclase (GGDEF)-like protein/putative nucleotidyltransferase with HDIG domain
MVSGRPARTFGVGSVSVELPRRSPKGIDPGTVPVARAQAMLGIGAAFVALVGVILPHPASFNEEGLLVTQAASLACGAVLLVWAGRVPVLVLHAMPAVATLLTTLSIVFAGDATSAYPMFYIWVGLYSFYILPAVEAGLQIAFAIANYAIVMIFVGAPTSVPNETEIHHLVVVVGTLVVGGVLLWYLRKRVELLVSRLSGAARLDLLTNLPNARALHESLTKEIDRARHAGQRLSVVVVDLDRFKAVNEAIGHKAADEVLCRIGELLCDISRRIDTVARTGPTQFTIVLPESGEDDAYLLAEQLLSRIRRGFRDEAVPLTASVGIATFPKHAISAEELIRLAEQALAAAKQLGRDRAVVSSAEVQEVLGGALRRPFDTQSHLATLVSLAEAIDLRDSGTAEHSKRVGAFSEQIARELGLNDYRVERVRLAGILHDVGKVGVPDAILCKAGPLDEGEWEEMRKHPEIGARILGARELVDIREWVLSSHERPDGKGYPQGLSGDEIPLEARILAVADAFEAMTGDRIYGPAISEEAAMRELEACAGSQFDPEVVDAFQRARDRARSVREPS